MIFLLAEQTLAGWKAIGGIALLTLVAGGFLLFASIMTCQLVIPDRVKKVATGMNLMLLLLPLLAVAVFAVLICIFSAASTVSGIKHTNDEDTDA